MEAVAVAFIVCGTLLVLMRWATEAFHARAALRHQWRTEVLELRARVFKADELEKLSERIKRLEMKGLR